MRVEFKRIAGKIHKLSPKGLKQLVGFGSYQSNDKQNFDNKHQKRYNCAYGFCSFHFCSFRGINFHHRASTCGEYPNAIISQSLKSLFILFNKNPKHEKESLNLQLYAKNFYAQIKQEQKILLQSHFNLNLPHKAFL